MQKRIYLYLAQLKIDNKPNIELKLIKLLGKNFVTSG